MALIMIVMSHNPCRSKLKDNTKRSYTTKNRTQKSPPATTLLKSMTRSFLASPVSTKVIGESRGCNVRWDDVTPSVNCSAPFTNSAHSQRTNRRRRRKIVNRCDNMCAVVRCVCFVLCLMVFLWTLLVFSPTPALPLVDRSILLNWAKYNQVSIQTSRSAIAKSSREK